MTRLGFFLSEAWEIQTRDRSGSVANLTALTAVLFLLAIVLMAGFNIRGAARALEERKGIEVFLADGVSPERIVELEETFRGFGEVAEVVAVAPEEALREIESEFGGVDIVSALGENPLSASFRIRLTPQAASRAGALADLSREIEAYEGVEEVLYGGSWIRDLEHGLRGIYWATAGAGLLAAFAVFLVLWNTLKLAFLNRRETIRILKIVGATPAFIRSPYLLLGMIHTGVAAILALGLAAAARFLIAQLLPGTHFLPPLWIGTFLSGTVLLGLVSSVASIEPVLRHLERRHETVTH